MHPSQAPESTASLPAPAPGTTRPAEVHWASIVHWPKFIKWNLMAAALFWLLVYQLSDTAEKLPDFVYVNF